MNRGIYNLSALVLLCWIASALHGCDTPGNIEDPDPHYFVKYYGGVGNQSGVDMQVMSDGTLLLLGNFAERDNDRDLYLMRVSAEGDVLWERRIGDELARDELWTGKDLEPTVDGNFVVLADHSKGSGRQSDIKLIKISPDGNILDSLGFGTQANDFGRSVTALSDGGFIVSGTTEFTNDFGLVNVTDPDLGDIFNYRLDQNLDLLPINDWAPTRVSFQGRLDVAVKAVEKPGEFYIFGYSNINLNNTNPSKRLGLFYFKRDLNGQELSPFFPGDYPDEVTIEYVHPLEDAIGGGVLVVGSSVNSSGASKIFYSRLRSSLTFFSREQDAPVIYGTVPLQNGNIRGVAAASSFSGEVGYLILANEIRSTTGAANIWLSKVDQSQNVLWSTTIGSEAEDDRGAAVAELPDGKILILGTIGMADNQSKMALIKMNRRGQFLK